MCNWHLSKVSLFTKISLFLTDVITQYYFDSKMAAWRGSTEVSDTLVNYENLTRILHTNHIERNKAVILNNTGCTPKNIYN